jgi:hypothetical protein
MRYAIFCYNNEEGLGSLSQQNQSAVMEKLGVINERLVKEGRLGPVARLMPTAAAKTLHKDHEPPLVVDGPFAETKEQLLGFYIVNCHSMDEALAIARELGAAVPSGSYEVRPLASFSEGAACG